MKHTVTVDIYENDVEGLKESSKKEIEEMIKSLFERLDEGEHTELLSGFCLEDRETFDGLVYVADTSLDDETSGVLTASFTGSIYNGCKDLDVLNEYDEGVTFDIDLDEQRILFESETPDPVEREPDYY